MLTIVALIYETSTRKLYQRQVLNLFFNRQHLVVCYVLILENDELRSQRLFICTIQTKHELNEHLENE